jgi:hypothetical protein
VSLLVAHRAHGQVRLLAADAIDSLPADLLKKLPGVAAQVAALRLPLDVAAALGDTEEERAAADVLAWQSAMLEFFNVNLASDAAQAPQELTRAREALARAHTQSPSDAAAHAVQERETDAALRAAKTTTAFRLALARQLTVRKILFERICELVRGAWVSDEFATLFIAQRFEEFKLVQAESAARFALRNNGRLPADRLQGPTRALAAAMKALLHVRERDERERVERERVDCERVDCERVEREARGERAVAAKVDAGRAGRDLDVGFATMSISPQPVALSAASAESGATTSAASSGSSAGAPELARAASARTLGAPTTAAACATRARASCTAAGRARSSTGPRTRPRAAAAAGSARY